ncbi:MAG: glutaredoxin 3 [Flavobacteriaceae bacterium]|jgi:glutaredoxin 3
MKKVEIYSTPSCGYCHKAKDFFKENDIEYTEYDVSEDADKRSEMIEKTGQMGVPVIIIDDEMMVGFNEDKLSELLEIGL